MKIVVNRCYGGFGLSEAATDLYIKKAGLNLYKWHGEHSRLLGATYTTVPREEYDAAYQRAISTPPPKGEGPFREVNSLSWSIREKDRADPILVEVVEELGKAANTRFSDLEIVEIPDGTDWQIEEYDGKEWVAEKHRTW